MKQFSLLIFLFSTILLRGQTELSDSLIWKKAALLRAVELENTFKIRDYKFYAQINHPKIVEMMGGSDAFAKTLEEQMKEIEKEVKMDSTDFGVPFNFVKCDSNVVNCILPQTIYIKLQDTLTMKSTVFLLGNSDDNGRTWYFLDASNGSEFLDAVVPKRCKILAIPDKKQEFIRMNKKN